MHSATSSRILAMGTASNTKACPSSRWVPCTRCGRTCALPSSDMKFGRRWMQSNLTKYGYILCVECPNFLPGSMHQRYFLCFITVLLKMQAYVRIAVLRCDVRKELNATKPYEVLSNQQTTINGQTWFILLPTCSTLLRICTTGIGMYIVTGC